MSTEMNLPEILASPFSGFFTLFLRKTMNAQCPTHYVMCEIQQLQKYLAESN